MAASTKEQLKTLSNDKFFDNNNGGIAPEGQREFNDKVLDSISSMVGSVVYTLPNTGGVLKHLDGSDITINDSYEYLVHYCTKDLSGETALIRHLAGAYKVDIYKLDGDRSGYYNQYHNTGGNNYASNDYNNAIGIQDISGVPRMSSNSANGTPYKILQWGFQGVCSFGLYALQKLLAIQ